MIERSHFHGDRLGIIALTAIFFVGACSIPLEDSMESIHVKIAATDEKKSPAVTKTTAEKKKTDGKKSTEKKSAEKKSPENTKKDPTNNPETGFLKVNVITNSLKPHNELFRDNWNFHIYAIDEQCRRSSPTYYGDSSVQGKLRFLLPNDLKGLPLLVYAYNDAAPLRGAFDTLGRCYDLEIFVPPHCFDKTEWNLSPYGDAVWHYYKRACQRGGDAWDPTRVDCATWGANLKTLYNTEKIFKVLRNAETMPLALQLSYFHDSLRENQQLLTPTSSPICLAEHRHNGGGMERGAVIERGKLSVTIDDNVEPFSTNALFPDDDPVSINLASGLPEEICSVRIADSQMATINGIPVVPTANFYLDDEDFMGTIHDQHLAFLKRDISLFNTRLSNGKELDHDKFDDACSMTTIMQVTNLNDDEQDLFMGSGITFSNLFGSQSAQVFKTSDGDDVVDDTDTWALFFTINPDLRKTVLGVEFLGHRREDFRDVLHMKFDSTSEDLFLGLRTDYELNEEPSDGEQAFMIATLHVWDESTPSSRRAIYNNVTDCYEAADPWTHQFFTPSHFFVRDSDCITKEKCSITGFISALEAAEFAVRSQCFSNSIANQRFRTDDSGYWSLNTDYGVATNVMVNPGWLGPEMTFEIYIQKFDEAVFKGPRTIAESDITGSLSAAIPTIVEGDKILIQSQDSCCADYALVIPCVPAFTGFSPVAPRYNFPTKTPPPNRPNLKILRDNAEAKKAKPASQQ